MMKRPGSVDPGRGAYKGLSFFRSRALPAREPSPHPLSAPVHKRTGLPAEALALTDRKAARQKT